MKYLFLISLLFLISCAASANQPAPALPSDPAHWLDGKPLQWQDLSGKVVLVNVWTFRCWNSYRSLPWIVSLQKRYPQLQIIGVHSPEFDHEKNRNDLRKTMDNYNVHYPQLLDDDLSYWRQLNNRYWPAFYLVDKQGRIRATFAGETHANDAQAKRVEKQIESLIAE